MCFLKWGVPFASFSSKSLCRMSRWLWPRVLSNYCFSAGPRAREVLCSPFKSRFFFLQPTRSIIQKPPSLHKPHVPGTHLPCSGSLCWEPSVGVGDPHSSERTSVIVFILLLVKIAVDKFSVSYQHLVLSVIFVLSSGRWEGIYWDLIAH